MTLVWRAFIIAAGLLIGGAMTTTVVNKARRAA